MNNKTCKYLFFILSLTIFQIGLKAQSFSSDSIQWNASSFVDKISNVSVGIPCTFITYNNEIRWIQKDGEVVYTFAVGSIEGVWSDVNVNGTISYNVSLDGLVGKITISKVEGAYAILLDVNGVNDSIKNEYSITGFEIL